MKVFKEIECTAWRGTSSSSASSMQVTTIDHTQSPYRGDALAMGQTHLSGAFAGIYNLGVHTWWTWAKQRSMDLQWTTACEQLREMLLTP